jgi:Ca2+-binding RTX toxin-like protein
MKDKKNNTIDSGGGDDIISGDRGDDILSGGRGNDDIINVNALVSAMSAAAPPTAGQMTLPDNSQKELNATIVASLQ